MSLTTSLAALTLAAADPGAAGLETQLTGLFTNEEQAYFEKDAGRTPPPWTALHIEKSEDRLTLTPVDAFGTPVGPDQAVKTRSGAERDQVTVGTCTRNFDRSDGGWTYSALQNRKRCNQPFQIIAITASGLTLRLADGTETRLNRARPVQCWAAVKKAEPKADGSPDWHFARKLELHDQGGRVMVGGGDSGADPLILRMRAVYWPAPSTNRPSMVLYVHKPDAPDSAVSYSWADINASRVGLNLRWMQSSCTIIGAERDSEVTTQNFRG